MEEKACPVRTIDSGFKESYIWKLRDLIDAKSKLPFAKITLPSQPSKDVPAELLAWNQIESKDPHFVAFKEFIKIAGKKVRWENMKPARWNPKTAACALVGKTGLPEEVKSAIEYYAHEAFFEFDFGFEESEAVYAAGTEIILPAFVPDAPTSEIGALLALYKAGVLKDKEYASFTIIRPSRGWEAILKKVNS